MEKGSVNVQGGENLTSQPKKYFNDMLKSKMPAGGLFGTGIISLPQYQYEAVLCMEVLTKYIRQEGLELIEYHDMAVNSPSRDSLTQFDDSYITQVFIKADMEPEVFERKLGAVRLKAENQIHSSKLKHRQLFSMSKLSSVVIH